MNRRVFAMLVVEQGLDEVSVFPIESDEVLIGRNPNADVFLDNPFVSGQHASLIRQGDQTYIRDKGSKNGTYVNGSLISEDLLWIHSGDRIEFANGSLVLRFQELGTTVTLPKINDGGTALSLDRKGRDAFVQGQKLDPPLSLKEFDVLSLLYDRKGEACHKDEIAEKGWPSRTDGDVSDQEIEQCIRRLRLRIEPEPSEPLYIVTIRGFGYKLVLDQPQQ